MYERPVSGFVARALGPANLLPGRVAGSANGSAPGRHGARARAGSAGGAAAAPRDARVLVLARPEHVMLRAGGSGTVVSAAFLRDAVELVVADHDAHLRVRLPTALALPAGSGVSVGFRGEQPRARGRGRTCSMTSAASPPSRRGSVATCGPTCPTRRSRPACARTSRRVVSASSRWSTRASTPVRRARTSRCSGSTGVERGDLAGLVRDDGVEGALERLRDVGVHVTAEELKGRAPLVRGSLTLHVRPEGLRQPPAERRHARGDQRGLVGGAAAGRARARRPRRGHRVRPSLGRRGRAARQSARPLAQRAAGPVGSAQCGAQPALGAPARGVVEPDARGAAAEPA